MMFTCKAFGDTEEKIESRVGWALFGLGLATAGSYAFYRGYTNFEEWNAAFGPVAFLLGSIGQDYLGKLKE